jgi:imidazole glycerol-phosphate synthase subunit HisH
MSKVAIVDYGMCNLDSVKRAVEECGGSPLITSEPAELRKASRIILPGVGAFPDAMQNLRRRSLDAALAEQAVERGIPLLGICLGMQLLAAKGMEVEETRGLGWIDGEVRRLEPTPDDARIPHIGWNEVFFDPAAPLFRGIEPGRDFYFVHSFHLAARNPRHVLATTPYAGGFVSAVQRDWIFGVQFHPEKSQRAGFQVLKNFLRM